MRRTLRRARNALTKLASGLSLLGENITPDVPNDLYQAHASIYQFFAPFCAGRRVLDIGCGAGYGAALLAREAAEVLAFDLDPRNVRYARRRYRAPNLRYEIGDALAFPDRGAFEVITSSNVFEHLTDVPRALDAVAAKLVDGGTFLIAVPPIVDEQSFRANEAIRYHRSNFYVDQWLAMLQARFAAVVPYAHQMPEGVVLDFGDPFPSRVLPGDFRFVQQAAETYPSIPTLTALFVCRNAARVC